MQKDKIESLLGFARKAGYLQYGADALPCGRKKLYLVLIDQCAAPKTRRRVEEIAEQLHIPLIISRKPLQDILFKQNCKVAGLADKQMSEAVLKNLNENFQLYVAEVKH